MSRRVLGYLHLAMAAAVYSAVALYATWPMARLGADHLISHFSIEDLILNVWIKSWDIHTLATHPLSLFQANIMHPTRNTLALSEHLLGQLPFFAPVLALTGTPANPILAFNIDVLLTFVLCGIFTHALVAAWSGSRIAGYAAGLAFAFAPWRLESFHWAHLLGAQYFAVVLYAFDRAATSRRSRWAVAAAAALTVQALCSYYLAFLAFALVGSYLLADAAVRGVRGRERTCAGLAAALLAPAAVMWLLSRPYVEMSRAGVISAPPDLSGETLARIHAAFGGPARILGWSAGWGATALAALALPAFVRTWRDADREAMVRLAALGIMVIVALGCATGPNGFFGGWFAPYAWLAAVVPGFSAFRLPARFGFLCSFALSVLGGLGVGALLARFTGRSRAPLAVTVVAFALALLPLRSELPLRAFPMPVGEKIPQTYRWLAAHGGGQPLLELPVKGSVPAPGTREGRAETMAMYFSTVHWLPILNGYSGYYPASYTELMRRAVRLPDADALRFLVDCAGLRWVLLHERRSESRAWQGARDLELRASFPEGHGTDHVYEVMLRPAGPCPVDLSTARLEPEGSQ